MAVELMMASKVRELQPTRGPANLPPAFCISLAAVPQRVGAMLPLLVQKNERLVVSVERLDGEALTV